MSEPRIPWTHKPTGRSDGRDRRARSAERLALLADAPLFEGLAKSQLRRIAKVSGARTFDPGEELVKEGVPGRVFYIVVEGQAKIVRRGRTIERVGPGDSFGEMAILTTAPRSASVIAESPMEVLTLSGPHLRTILLDQPRIAVRLLDTLANRLADLDRRFTA
jgi:CRP-like cAMP-binding protein